MAHGGEHHTAKIRGQPILLQPVGYLVLTNQVGHNAQLVSPLVQGSDHFCPPSTTAGLWTGGTSKDSSWQTGQCASGHSPAAATGTRELPVASLLVLPGPSGDRICSGLLPTDRSPPPAAVPPPAPSSSCGHGAYRAHPPAQSEGAAQVDRTACTFFVHPSSLSADRQMLSGSAAHSSYAPNANVFDFLSLFYGRLLFSVKGGTAKDTPLFCHLTKSPEIAVLY